MHSIDSSIVKIIGTNLHSLEELFLDVNGPTNGNSDVIKYLVTGCSNLRILHIEWNVTLDAVQYLLLSLPNLIEFKRSLMVFALANIIQDSRPDRVSAIRNLYIGTTNLGNISIRDVLKFAPMVMRHLNSITKLDITVAFNHYKESLTTFYVTLSNKTQLTELTLKNHCSDKGHLLPILEAIGHQLKLLDCIFHNYSSLGVLDQCRGLRVLCIRVRSLNTSNVNDKSYGGDLQEEFTTFYYLQKLHLDNVTHAHFNSALLKSLIASPVLREVKLVSAHIVTDHIIESSFHSCQPDRRATGFYIAT